MKKILQLSHTDISFDSRILKEINAASNSGYNVIGIGMKAKDADLGFRDSSNSANIVSLDIIARKLHYLPRYIKNPIVYLEFFFKSLPKTVSFQPNIIHCNDTTALPIALVAKLITRARLIYDAHELESNRNGQGKFSRFLTMFFEKLSWPFIDALIVVSPSINNWYQNNIGYKKVAIVMNSPDLAGSSCERNNYLREYFHIPSNECVFIYIGGLGPGRGIRLIIDVFTDFSLSSHIVFMGYGSYYDELDELSKKHRNIHVHPAVTHDKVVSIARSADVGMCLIEDISLSDYYCLPNKLFEYCFAGIPVLASDFPDICSVVTDYKLGLVTSLEIDKLKKAVKEFEKNIIDVSFNICDLQPLCWDEQAKKLLGLYHDVLN